MPPENTRFSDVFREYKMARIARNGVVRNNLDPVNPVFLRMEHQACHCF